MTEHAYKGPLLKIIADLDGFIKVGIASPRSVRVSSLREEIVKSFPDWSIRELLLNAIIHRDYQIGNAPIKFYDYNGLRLEISNPGGLYGQAKPDNFPFVSDYRNPLLAEAVKVLGYVNKFNRGISKVKVELENNGNPPPIFDVNKRTEFRVTLLPSDPPVGITENEPLNQHAGEINEPLNQKATENEPLNEHSGEINEPLNQKTTKNEPLNRSSRREEKKNEQKKRLLEFIEAHPRSQQKELANYLNISLATLKRLLEDMTSDPANARIEHRGSKKAGGWFIKS